MLCRPKPSRLNSPRGLVGDLFIVQFNIMIISQTKSLRTTHYVCLNYLGFNGLTSSWCQFLKLKPKSFNSCFQHKDKLDFYIDCIVQLHQNWLSLKRLSSIIACHKKFKQGSQLLWPCNWCEALWQEIHVLISPSVCKIHGGGLIACHITFLWSFTVILTAPLPLDSPGVPSLHPGATQAAGSGPRSLSC